MNIAIIGTGNVGQALASRWLKFDHRLALGVRDIDEFKGKELLQFSNISVHKIKDAVEISDVILLATPAKNCVEIVKSLGNTQGKIIIDAMNVINNNGPLGYATTSEAILANTDTSEVVKCFNTTGFNNMIDPIYQDHAIDMFVSGDSSRGKDIAKQLAKEAGFGECYDIGGNDKFFLMEQFAFFWINLAMFQGQGREIGFKLLKR